MQSDNRTFDYLKRSGEWNLYIYIYIFESFELSTNKYCKRSYRAERFFVSKETKYVVKLRSRDSFFFSPPRPRCLGCQSEGSVRGFCHREG